MTAPTPPPEQEPMGTEEAVVAIAGLLAAAGSVGATFAAAEVAREGIAAILRRIGVSAVQATQLVAMDADRPAPPVVPLSPVSRDVYGDGPTHRARYLVTAAKRLTKAVAAGTATGASAAQQAAQSGQNAAQSVVSGAQAATEAMGKAVAKEKTYFVQHQTAQTKREQAAQALDAAVNTYGQKLGWYAVDDERTTPGCRWADGRNFDPENPPPIGLPGFKHGGNCRCHAGPPHPAGPVMEPAQGSQQDYEIAASVEAGAMDDIELSILGKIKRAFDPAKHPRAKAGTPTGGQFIKVGKARNSAGAVAQANPKANAAFSRIAPMSRPDRKAALAAMSDDDLKAFSRVAYSFQSDDPDVTATRGQLDLALERRGLRPEDYGAPTEDDARSGRASFSEGHLASERTAKRRTHANFDRVMGTGPAGQAELSIPSEEAIELSAETATWAADYRLRHGL